MTESSVDKEVYLSSNQCTLCKGNFGYPEIFDLHVRAVHTDWNVSIVSLSESTAVCLVNRGI